MLYRADPWLHVIAGCMSSGKTDELLRLLRRAEIAKRRILLVRPDVDDRTPSEYAESRSKARYPSVLVPKGKPVEILSLARERDVDLVGIEEAQFFDDGRSSGRPRRSARAGATSSRAASTPTSPAARSARCPSCSRSPTRSRCVSAICVVCGETATRTQRLVGGRPAAIDDPLIVIGGFDGPAIETYEARCLRHHEVAPAGAARGVVADDVPARVAAGSGEG